MSDANLRQIRVLHLVSAGGVASALQPALFMPLLTRLPRQRVKAQVACLSPGAVPAAVLRQNGVPTFDLALSRKRFSPKAFQELVQATRHFRPDVIQAWGHTAQIISTLLRKRCEWKPRLVWSVSDTTPLAKNAGFIDRQKLKYAAKFAARADRIVYASESGASQHRRVGFPDGGHETIPPGVDATRFKPDFAARRKLREELNLPGEAFVVGMVAPFQAEYDHATLIRATGELIKTNPNIALVLAGHGVQKGNAPLMALVGGGALSTRVHLLGEWSDINALYNACDVVCSSAVNDLSRMNVVMAMLCGVPVVATGMGAQGELIGQHGVAIEPGSPAAFIKGINRVMQLTPEKRTHLAQGARKHALANYVYVRSLQKYLQLYYDLIGRQSLVTNDLPTPEIDASLTVPPALPTEAEMSASKRKPITVVDLSDPDSLESKVTEREPEELPKWRLEQEQERNKREAELAAKVAASKSVGDVLEVFESQQVKALSSESPMTERARGVADDSEELLSPELLAADAPPPPRVSTAPSGAKKSAAPTTAQTASQPDAAKQAALKAARMAALQPIAPAPKPSTAKSQAASPVTRPPVSSPITRPPMTIAASAADSKPAEAAAPPTMAGSAAELSKHVESAPPATSESSRVESSPQARSQPTTLAASATELSKPELVPAETITDSVADFGSLATESVSAETITAAVAGSAPFAPESGSATASLEVAAPGEQKTDFGSTQPLETLPEGTMAGLASLKWPMTADLTVATGKQKVDIESTQPLGALAQDLANAALAAKDLPEASTLDASKPGASKLHGSKLSASRPGASKPDAGGPDASKPDAGGLEASTPDAFRLGDSKPDISFTQSLELPADLLPQRHVVEAVNPPASRSPAAEVPLATGSLNEFGELTLLATGEWQAMQRSDSKSETKADAAKTETKAATNDAVATATKAATNDPARTATKAAEIAQTKEAAAQADKSKLAELSGAETLSLISTPAPAADGAATEPTVQLAVLSDPPVEPKRAANGK